MDRSMTTDVLAVEPAPTIRRRDRFDSFEEVERLARRRLPRSLYEEVSRGSDRDLTFRANLEAFEEIGFRPRAAAAVEGRSLSTTVLGTEVSMPLLLDPVGGLRILHPDGAPAAARAAKGAGTICGISMSAGHSISDVVAGGGGALWAQLYMFNGREGAEQVIEHAAVDGCRALVLTVDCAIAPKLRPAMRINLRNAIEFGPELIVRPRWLARFVRDGLQMGAANAALGIGRRSEIYTVHWSDMAWIRDAWRGPIVVKGVITADDARRAVDHGAAAVIVSNHGGIGLDGAPATMRALPEVVQAVGSSAEVLMDGGVRHGTDVIKALALGARAVLVGRPYALALAVGGEATVRHMLEIFRRDIDRALALVGAASVQELDPSYVIVPTPHGGPR